MSADDRELFVPTGTNSSSDGLLGEVRGVLSSQFFAWDAMREQRDEALVRGDELEVQRDQARRAAASLEAEVAQVRELHSRGIYGAGLGYCRSCSRTAGSLVRWPCETAAAVYLTAEAVES